MRLTQRIVGAFVRRTRHARVRWIGRRRELLAPAVLDSLKASLEVTTSPALLGASIGTLCDFGQRGLAVDAARRLLSLQWPSGEFPEASGGVASLWDAGHALRGLLALEARYDLPGWCGRELAGAMPVDRLALLKAIELAAGALSNGIDSAGHIRCDERAASFHAYLPAAALISCLPPLAIAARRIHETTWQARAARAAATLLRENEMSRWNAPSHWLAERAEALLELGRVDAAHRLLRLPAAAQRADGDVPATVGTDWTSSAGLAHLASIWFQLENRRAGNLALECVARRQLPGGGIPGSWGRGARLQPQDPWPWAALRVLDASRRQVAARFTGKCEHLPRELASDDARLLAIIEQLRRVHPLRCVVDAGCGNGRFLARLQAEFPGVEFRGIDPSPSMLAELPAGVVPQAGSLLELPLAKDCCDAAIAVESLEHSLTPRQAVAELCRVVRPLGQVIVVDKHQDFHALSERDPWEQWFLPDQVRDWLGDACIDVVARPLGPRSSPLMLWTGRKASAADCASQRAA